MAALEHVSLGRVQAEKHVFRCLGQQSGQVLAQLIARGDNVVRCIRLLAPRVYKQRGE